MKNKVTLLNIIFSVLLQIVSAISGFIFTRLIIFYFGSNMNGLVASLNQFLSYITLLEGGVTSVITANLYKPLVLNDNGKLSSVLVTARSFFRKIGLIFLIYTLALGVVYPLVVDTKNNFIFVLALTYILSIGLLMQYLFSLTLTTLMNADKKSYIISIVSILLTILNIFALISVVKFFPNILVFNIVSSLFFVIKPLILGIYVNKNYKIDWKAPIDNSLINQRWNGFAINFAYFIHISTDITVLTLLSDFETISVYNTYYIVISKINFLIHSLASGIEPAIGQAYAQNDMKDLENKMDLYEYIVFFSVGLIFSLTALLITPFVMLYTKGVCDADYTQPVFGYLIVLAEAIYLIKYPHVTLAYVSNKFKEITLPAYIEAAINIVVSVLLLKTFGLIGIAIGTCAGMTYRLIFHIYFTKKIIPGRRPSKFYRKLLVFCISTAIAIFLCAFFLPFKQISVLFWLTKAFIYGLIILFVYFLSSIIFFKKELVGIFQYLNIYKKNYGRR